MKIDLSRVVKSLQPVFAVLALILAACGNITPPAQPKIARVEVSPTALLLTKAGESQTLSAKVFDDQGKELTSAVVWSTSNPAAASVDANGKVTAISSLGSAQITATAGGVKGSIVVVMAQPVAGAVLIRDAQIVGEPQPLNPSAAFGVGFEYRVVLQGVSAPSVGSILLSSGEKPVAGRVVAVNGSSVTLEVVPIDAVFAQLNINETINLAEAPVITPSAVAQNFDTQRLPDGRIRLIQKAGRVLNSQAEVSSQAEFGAGPFQCKTEGNLVQIQLAKSELAFSPNLKLETVWSDAQKKIVVKGQPTVSLEVTPILSASLNAKVTCKLTLAEVQVPFPGPVGIFLGAVIPFGAGFELEGKAPVAQVGAKFKTEVGADFQMGFACTAVGCGKVESLKPILSGDATPIIPSLQANRIEASFFAFFFADLEAGARLASLSKFRIGAIESAAGLKLEAKLASEETQVGDAAYASTYKLAFEAVIGAGDEFESFLKMLKVTVAKLELKLTQDIAFSPTATATADKAEFREADVVKFKVRLDPVKAEFPVVGYNVESVRIYRKSRQPDGSVVLVLVAQGNASLKQTEFDLSWAATLTGTVKDNFVVFVQTRLLPDLRLELGDVGAPPSGGFAGTFSLEWTDSEQFPLANGGISQRLDKFKMIGRVKAATNAQGQTGLTLEGIDLLDSVFESKSTRITENQIQGCVFRLVEQTTSIQTRTQPELNTSFIPLTTSGSTFSFRPATSSMRMRVHLQRTVVQTRTRVRGTCTAENLTPQNVNEDRTVNGFLFTSNQIPNVEGQITQDAQGRPVISVDDSRTVDLSPNSSENVHTFNYTLQLRLSGGS